MTSDELFRTLCCDEKKELIKALCARSSSVKDYHEQKAASIGQIRTRFEKMFITEYRRG